MGTIVPNARSLAHTTQTAHLRFFDVRFAIIA